jgi:hypothetical protein
MAQKLRDAAASLVELSAPGLVRETPVQRKLAKSLTTGASTGRPLPRKSAKRLAKDSANQWLKWLHGKGPAKTKKGSLNA